MYNIRRGLEQRRGDIAQVSDSSAKIHKINGRVLITGRGTLEASFDVNFPVAFMDIPAVYFGCIMPDNLSATIGRMPTMTSQVLRWVSDYRLGARFLYRGATIGVVITDSPGQMWVNWHAEGVALRNPIEGVDSPEVII